jgi:signal transduction histidine kinase/ligand-binding sensor domain-containing protein/CheY-like chemotaxis protein
MARIVSTPTFTRCLVVLLALAAAGPTIATGIPPIPAFRVYGVDQGLPNSTVADLAVDRDGFVWAATQDGLARFDGSGFQTWRYDPTEPGSIRGNVVQALLVDAANRLWVGVEDGGLSVMESERESFAHIGSASNDPGTLRTPHVFALAEGPDGTIWAGNYDGGLHRIEPATLALTRWPEDGSADPLPDRTVTALRFDRSGWLWVGTRRGLVAIAPARLGGDPRGPVGRFLSGTMVVALSPAEDGGIYVGALGGLFRGIVDGEGRASLEPIAVPETLLPPGPTSFRAVVADRGDLWVATTRGLLRRDPDGRWSRHVASPGKAFAPPGNWLWSMARDREGGLWVGHRGVGLSYLPPLWRNFTLYRGVRAIDEGLGDFSPLHAACPDGTLWLVRPSGTLARFDPGSAEPVELPDLRGTAASSNRIRAAACASDGRLLLGYRGGLSVLRPDGRAAVHFDGANPATAEPIRVGAVHRIATDPHGNLWIALLEAGVGRFDPDTGRFLAYPRGINGPRSLDVEQFGFDRGGHPWVAGEAGLDRLDPARNAFVAVEGIPDGRVEAFAFGDDGSIVLHRIGRLLAARFDGRRLEPTRSWGPADGLPVATMTGLFHDRAGSLWLVGPRGIWRLDPTGTRFRAYGPADGLPVRGFSLFPPERGPGGTIFVGSDHGVVGFDPARLDDADVPPRLVLERVRYVRDDRVVEWEPGDGPLVLRHADRELAISVRALAFADPPANRYRFRLEGLDADWVETGARGERVFPTLPPGRYALVAQGANPQGSWSEPIGPFEFAVAEPPWRTWPAYLAYGLLATLLLGAAFRLHRVRLQRRHAMALAEQRRLAAERQSQAKSEFLADVGHEIRTPMAGLLGMAELLLRDGLTPAQRQRAEAIQRSGGDLLRLINDLLDLSRIEAGRFELIAEPVDLAALVEEVAALERPLAEGRGLALGVRIDPECRGTCIGDRLRLKQILLNLVSNAIKFTDSGSVSIELAARPGGGQRLVVRDTGRGIGAAEQAQLFRRYEQVGAERRAGSGLGLSIVRGLIERMGGTITLDSEPGRGSTFTVDLDLPASATGGAGAVDGPGALAPDAVRSLAGARVVVVEDDPVIREVLLATLAEAGVEVRAAANGLEGLVLLGDAGVSAAVLDLDLPGLDGYGILAWIRGRAGAAAALPVVALTANSDPAVEARCRAAGFDAFLRKPVPGPLLRSTLERVIGSRAAAPPP